MPSVVPISAAACSTMRIHMRQQHAWEAPRGSSPCSRGSAARGVEANAATCAHSAGQSSSRSDSPALPLRCPPAGLDQQQHIHKPV